MVALSLRTWRIIATVVAITVASILITRYLIEKAKSRIVETHLTATQEGRLWWEQAQQFIDKDPKSRALWVGRIGRQITETTNGSHQLIALEIPFPKRISGTAEITSDSLYISLRSAAPLWQIAPAVDEIWCVTGTVGDKNVVPYSMQLFKK